MATFLHYLAPVAVGVVALVLLAGLVNMMRGGSPKTSQTPHALARHPAVRRHRHHDGRALLRLAVTPHGRLNRIYTRTGDDGTTALATGERRPKSDLRFETIGTIDELNAHVGLARLRAGDPARRPRRHARPHPERPLRPRRRPRHAGEARPRALRIVAAQVERLESEIDALNAGLAPLTSFVLPGGTPAAAALHLCRTVARRAERLAVALAGREPVNPEAMRYINRLSDFFFVAARLANDGGAGDVLWVPGENR